MVTPLRPRHTLPVPATPLVGRELELAAACAALLEEGVRLLTVTGPPGVGKTRLALAVAGTLRGDVSEGLWFVSLAPLSDADQVAPTVAATLGVPPGADTPGGLEDGLIAALRSRRALLVLDNFEHLLDAAPLVARLLSECPDLRVLATSRRPLRLAGEREFPVVPLAVPAARPAADLAPGTGEAVDLAPEALEELRRSPAVTLFVQRARDVRPDFVLTGPDAPAVAEICRRLDGLPLALELAAARTKLLPPGALLARLSPALPLLAGGPRDAPARQQTLRQTVAWSDALLSAGERADFRRLAVFAGGCTLEGAAEVLGGWSGSADACPPAAALGDHDALERLGALLDHSLLRAYAAPGGAAEPRFWMLETIREYALERLAAAGETEPARRRHAIHFLGLAERAAGAMHGPRQAKWYDRLERDQPNLRAAARWALDAGDGELAVRLAQALRWFWEVRGYVAEGHRLAEAALALPDVAGPGAPWRPRALAAAAHLRYLVHDHPGAAAVAGEGAALARARGDTRCLADALIWQGMSTLRIGFTASGSRRLHSPAGPHPGEGTPPAAPDAAAPRRLLEESLACWRAVGEAWGEAQALEYLGATLRDTGDLAGSRPRYEAALALRRGLGDTRGVAQTLQSLANLALRQGDHDRATRLSDESLALASELGDRTRVATSLFSLAEVAQATGDPGVASRFSAARLTAAVEGGDAGMVALASFRLAELARSAGDSAGAASHYSRCLHLCRQHGFHGGAALSLVGLAALALQRGRAERAARLLGAAEVLRAGAPLHLVELPRESARSERTSAAIQAALAAHPAAPSWLEAGRSLSFERAVEEALQEAAAGAPGPDPPGTGVPSPAAAPETAGTELLTAGAAALTPREREVASLVASGHTNRQIAARLVIAERTAMRHVEHVMAKLGVHSRAQIAAWAAHRGLDGSP